MGPMSRDVKLGPIVPNVTTGDPNRLARSRRYEHRGGRVVDRCRSVVARIGVVRETEAEGDAGTDSWGSEEMREWDGPNSEKSSMHDPRPVSPVVAMMSCHRRGRQEQTQGQNC